MPLVRVDILKGKSAAYKKALLDGIHAALQTALGIEDWDRFQRLYELDEDCFERSFKTDQFTMIEITMFQGRSAQAKAELYERIVKELSDRLGIANTDVFIVLHEPADENWGLAGKQRSST